MSDQSDQNIGVERPKLGPLVEATVKALAIGSAALYVSGFLIVNAHLSKYGFYDYSLANPRFMLAGGVCALFVICWYQFSARFIIHMRDDLVFAAGLLQKQGASKGWLMVAGADISFIDFGFKVFAAATLFSFLILESGTQFLALGALMVYWSIIFPLDRHLDIDLKNPTMFLAINVPLKICFIAVFIWVAWNNYALKMLALTYLGMSLSLNTLMDNLERLRVGPTLSVSLVGYAVTALVVAITGFGYFIFGHVQARYGGGAPVDATVIFRNQFAGSQPLETKILFLSDRSILLEREKRPTLMDVKDIASISFAPKTDISDVYELTRRALHWQ